jgi:hypothetical protein
VLASTCAAGVPVVGVVPAAEAAGLSWQAAKVPAATLAASPRPAIVRKSLRETSCPAWRNTVFKSSLVTDIEANKLRDKAARQSM